MAPGDWPAERGPGTLSAMLFRSSLRLLALLLTLASVHGVWACGGGTVPVHQVSGARLSPYSGRALSADEVRQLLLRALTARHWFVQSEQAGVIFARISHHNHYAVVRLDYNGLGYSISYVETSPSLHYDGANVHRRYNQWVERLDDAIQHEFEVYEHLPTTGELMPVTPAGAAAPLPAPPPPAAPSEPQPAPEAPAPAPAPSAPATPASGLAPVAPPPASAPRK